MYQTVIGIIIMFMTLSRSHILAEMLAEAEAERFRIPVSNRTAAARKGTT